MAQNRVSDGMMFKLDFDPRIIGNKIVDGKQVTGIGEFIRRTSLDEFPQFFNILKGDMSFIGPRPERPEIIDKYMEQMPEFAYRMRVKAGLAGYAQVYGKYNTNPHDKLEMDLMYINKMGIVEDLRLMFATVRVLFIKDSTEGIEAGKTTAKM